MKKVISGVSMILACLIFLVPPATAASVSHGAPELSAFLASLAGPAPVTVAKRPVPGKIMCFVTCPDGSAISCNGIVCAATVPDCAAGDPGHITCDGVTTWCPDTCFDCSIEEDNCAISCNPCSYRFTCDETTQTSTCRCILRGCPQ